MKNSHRLLCLTIPLLLQGCAYTSTFKNQDDISQTGYTSVDAKQRFLIYRENKAANTPSRTTTETTETTEATGSGQSTRASEVIEAHPEGLAQPDMLICAEPSPDVFSAFAASIDASIKKPEVYEAALKAAFSESSGKVGIRTQSIQLLRDAMYRNCEAYANGALSPTSYRDLQRSYQKSMVTLVAIEQLTGAYRAPDIILKPDAKLPEDAANGNEDKPDTQSLNVTIDLKNPDGKPSDEMAKAVRSLVAMVYIDEYLQVCATKLASLYDEHKRLSDSDKEQVSTSDFPSLYSLTTKKEIPKPDALTKLNSTIKAQDEQCDMLIQNYMSVLAANPP